MTLIEREAIDGGQRRKAPSRSTKPRPAATSSPNGVPLNHLVGRTFRVGEVVLRGYRLAEPCVYLEDMTRPGVRRALVHRAGLRADIVTGGVLHVGDEIREIEAGDGAARG